MVVLAERCWAACLVLTTNQLRYWENDETLFGHAVAVTHNENSIAHINYGNALDNAGREEEAQAQYHEGVAGRSPIWGAEVQRGHLYVLVNIGIYLDQAREDG